MNKSLNITIEQVKNATWKIHDNWTDGVVPETADDSQLLYHSAVATINGHEIGLTYTEEIGEECFLDGERVKSTDIFETEENEYGNDVTTFEPFEVVEEVTGVTIRDCDNLIDEWNFRQWEKEAQEAYKNGHKEYVEESYLEGGKYCTRRQYRIIDQQKYDEWWDNFDWEFCDDDSVNRENWENGDDAEEVGNGAIENDDEKCLIEELVRCGAIEEIKEDED